MIGIHWEVGNDFSDEASVDNGWFSFPVSPTSSEPTENQTQVYNVSSAPASDIKVDLSLTGSPMLGQPVQVRAVFVLQEHYKYAQNVTACIVLPDGIEPDSSSKLEWQGDMVPGTSYEISATIKAVKTGDWRIEARAFFYPNQYDCLGGTAYLYALVYEDHATVSDWPTRPTGLPMGVPTSPPTEKPREPSPGEGTVAPEPAPSHIPP